MTDTDRRTAADAITDALIKVGLIEHGPRRINEPGAPIASAAPSTWAHPILAALEADDSGRAAIVAWLLTPERLAALECQRRHSHNPERDRGGPCSICWNDARAILARLAALAASRTVDSSEQSPPGTPGAEMPVRVRPVEAPAAADERERLAELIRHVYYSPGKDGQKWPEAVAEALLDAGYRAAALTPVQGTEPTPEMARAIRNVQRGIAKRRAAPAASGYADATVTSGSYTSAPKTQPAAAQEPKP